MSPAELYLGPPPEDHNGSGEAQYHVRLPDFDGPLDLLLHLVRKSEFDIYDLPISEITHQYQETLEFMQELNLNVAGEFIFMAATLIHIKSKMLLPPPHEDGTEDDFLDDPRAELVARLLEYQRYKEAAQVLHQQETLRSAMWLRPESALEPLLPQEDDSKEDMVEVDLFELVSAFKSVLERVRQRKDYTIEQYTVTLDEMISRIKGRIQPGASLRFEQLFDDVTTRELLIVTFLALLELVRVRVLTLYQQKAFGTIHVNRPSHAERKE